MSLTYIRWTIRHDLPAVLEIERRSFAVGLDEAAMLAELRRREVIGMVATIGDTVVGHMIYELQKRKVRLITLAVHPDYRRMGVGGELVAKLAAKLTAERRSRLVVAVRETNLPAQLFFREQGLKATAVRRNHFSDIDEAAYVMRLDCQPAASFAQSGGRG